MTQADMLSINTVAAKLGLSVHQLRRWELMFGLEIKRGRGQQRQYRSEDLSILERIKELVEQGWPTSQIRPQLEAEGLITPKLIGVPQQSGNPEMLMEAVIGLRSFSERRFIEISKQIDELRQLMISITLRNELRNEIASPWQPVEEEFSPAPVNLPPQEISIGPAVNVSMPSNPEFAPLPAKPKPMPPPMPSASAMPSLDKMDDLLDDEDELLDDEDEDLLDMMPKPESAAGQSQPAASVSAHKAGLTDAPPVEAAEPVAAPVFVPAPAAPPPAPPPPVPAPAASAPAEAAKKPVYNLGDITDQNYLTVLGKALDLIGWSDEQADQYSQKEFGVAHWDELGRSQTEKLIAHLLEILNAGSDHAAV